jgi:AraC-like DNA-binding protein
MDVLSELLRVIRLSGVVHLDATFTQPWSVVSSTPETAPQPDGHGESISAFHVVVGGQCLVKAGRLPALLAESGDVIVVPRGGDHVVAGDLGLAPIEVSRIYPEPGPSADRIAVIRHGGGGDATRLICGFLSSERRFDTVLETLPRVLCIRSRGGALYLEAASAMGPTEQRIAEQHEAEWWDASLRYMITEATSPSPGNRAMLPKIAEFLFMAVLKWRLREVADGHGAWLAGLNDGQIGRAIALLHADPARPWTVEEIAREVAMSRSLLAKRFAETVGESPMQYLASWRMHLARELLRETRLSMAEIALRIGYMSEAAFSRAFRRLVGMPPAKWRDSADILPGGCLGSILAGAAADRVPA